MSIETLTTSNIGDGDGRIASCVHGVSKKHIQFKSIKAGTNVTVVNNQEDITISAATNAASGEANTTSNAGTGEGSLAKTKVGVDLPIKTIKAGTNVTITNNADDVTITAASGGSTPTGTGLRHVTSGVEDSTSKLVDTADINANQVTNAKLAQMETKTYKGRTVSGTGDPEDVAVATLKTDLALVKGDVGLGNVDNTSDANKPISTAEQTALNLKANLSSPTLVTPVIGAATGTSLAVTGAITSSGGGVGYTTGAGGTVTQATSRTTGVTLNKLCGNITMFSAAQAANALVTFTLTNSFIEATDFLLVQHRSATNGGAWVFSTVCGVGSATISIRNQTTASITEATPLRFTIIKGVTS